MFATPGGATFEKWCCCTVGFKELEERVSALESKEGKQEPVEDGQRERLESKVVELESKHEKIEDGLCNLGGEVKRIWSFLGDLVKQVQEVQAIVGSTSFEDLNIPSLSELGRQVEALAVWKQETVDGKEQEIQAVVEKIVMKISALVAPMVDSCIATNLPEAVSGGIEVVGEKLIQEVHLKFAVREADTRREVQEAVEPMLEKVMNAIDLKLAAKDVAVGSGCSEKERSVSGYGLD